MNLQPGQMLTPTLRLVRQLGRGGMGSIWIADHLALETPVAVKFMAPELVANSEVRARFAREAAAASQVKSPHVVQMLDHGVTADGVPFIAMELLQGEDLAHRVKRRGLLTPQQLTIVLTQTAKALGKAHERGIVHRDIKPENIFLCETDDDEIFVKVLDFGIAKASDSLSSSTKTGAVMGTAYYMSPEQIVGAKSMDHRTDVWALGVVTFEMMTGVKPFDGETIGALTLAIHGAPMPRPTAHLPGAAPAFDEWFARACARDVNQRFQSAKDLARAFSAIVTGEPAPRASADQTSPGGMQAHGGYASQPGWAAPPAQGSQPGYGPPPQFGPAPPPPAPFSATTMGAHTSSTSSDTAGARAMTMTTIPKSSTGLFVGIGAVALIGIGALAFFLTRGDPPSEPPAVSSPNKETPAQTQTAAGKKKPKKNDDDDQPAVVPSVSAKATASATAAGTGTAIGTAIGTAVGTGTAIGKTTAPSVTATGKTLSTATKPTAQPTSTATSEPKIF